MFKRIAYNGLEFHKGHSDLIELLVAGQAPVCLTCYSHHFAPRLKKGAPIKPMLNEGVGEVGGSVSILNGAPYPNAALLWSRWAISEEGQRAYAQAGETPARPNVEPTEKTRPIATYLLAATEVKEFPKYENYGRKSSNCADRSKIPGVIQVVQKLSARLAFYRECQPTRHRRATHVNRVATGFSHIQVGRQHKTHRHSGQIRASLPPSQLLDRIFI